MITNKLFRNINPNFFNVLSSKNKEIYIDCIFIMYDTLDSVEDSFQGERDKVVLKLIDYFDDKHSNSELEIDEMARTSRQKANAVINYLKDCGWLGEEELGDYKTSLNFFDYSIKIIEILKEINDTTQLEYTGEIYTVYSLLNNFDINEGIGIIEQAFAKTLNIIQKLKALKANIYRYYYEITFSDKDQDLHQLLEKLLVDYKVNFFDNAYYNLKTTDSISRYKLPILTSINKIYFNEAMMDKLAHDAIQIKKINDYNEAYAYIEERIRFIIDSFAAFENLILSIDRKNEQYISAAASKILFLTNRADDIEGIFNRLFTIVINSDEKTFDYSKIFNLFHARNLDTESLYTPRVRRELVIPDPIDLTYDLDEDIRRQKIANLTKNNIYNKKEIDKYVLDLLKDNDQIESVKVPLENEQDYVKLILIFLYSRSTNMSYVIEQTNNEVKVNFARFNNFYIIRKVSKK